VARYDLPKAAPEPLRAVQQLVNTIDLEREREWLSAWLEERDVRPTPRNLERARKVREALRELLYANNGHGRRGDPYAALDAAAAPLRVSLRDCSLVPARGGIEGALAHVAGVAYEAMRNGSWSRLKACRNAGCRWAFWDESKNQSARWCSMQLCGNRTKVRAYRRRAKAA
jgi:predicted RNA-binding Zn ribbon-like protein